MFHERQTRGFNLTAIIFLKLHRYFILVFWTLWRGISSNGRALASHARGTGIDTLILQEIVISSINFVLVIRLKYWKSRFIYLYLIHYLFIKGELAQMVERSLSMWEVRGSIPRFSTHWHKLDLFLAIRITCLLLKSPNIQIAISPSIMAVWRRNWSQTTANCL